MRNAGYGQVFKDSVSYVYDRLDEKKDKDAYEFYSYGNELENQINDLKAQVSDRRKVVMGYVLGPAGGRQAGMENMQPAISKDYAALTYSTKRLQYLKEEYTRWRDERDSYGDRLQSQIKALKREITDKQRMVTGYGRGASGVGEVGRPYLDKTIADNNALLEGEAGTASKAEIPTCPVGE